MDWPEHCLVQDEQGDSYEHRNDSGSLERN